MSRPKRIKKPVRVHLVLEEESLKQLQLAALRLSHEKQQVFSASDLMRSAIDKCYVNSEKPN